MASYKCIACGAVLQSATDEPGDQEKCPTCGALNIIPGPDRPVPGWPSGDGGGKGGRLSLVLSAVALAAAVAAVLVALFRSPLPGRGLGAYDFSTPKAAARSRVEMRLMGDIQASMELHHAEVQAERDKAMKQLESFDVDRVVEHDGKSLVLYSIKDEDGKVDHEADWFEKKEDGRYYPTFVSTYEWGEDSGEKAKIHKIIRDWKRDR